MGQILYQRPREKLRDRGVRTLSNAELLQVIIGSGGRGFTAARIAKDIVSLYDQAGSLTYQNLLILRGLGHAKVTQVIAAIELGGRLKHHAPAPALTSSDFSKLKVSTKRALEYTTINGAGEYIQKRSEILSDMPRAALKIRKMFADALHDYAESILVAIGSRSHQVDALDDDMLTIVKMIFDTSGLLEIRVNEVWPVNQTAQRPFRRKVV